MESTDLIPEQRALNPQVRRRRSSDRSPRQASVPCGGPGSGVRVSTTSWPAAVVHSHVPGAPLRTRTCATAPQEAVRHKAIASHRCQLVSARSVPGTFQVQRRYPYRVPRSQARQSRPRPGVGGHRLRRDRPVRPGPTRPALTTGRRDRRAGHAPGCAATPPGGIDVPRGRPAPSGAQHPSHRRVADAVAEPAQLTVHPAVSPGRFSRAGRNTRSRMSWRSADDPAGSYTSTYV
jgi:hypothetical protein